MLDLSANVLTLLYVHTFMVTTVTFLYLHLRVSRWDANFLKTVTHIMDVGSYGNQTGGEKDIHLSSHAPTFSPATSAQPGPSVRFTETKGFGYFLVLWFWVKS